jgi:hypothetical protein
LASETALAWVTADRLIALALDAPDTSEKHKATLRGKHGAVKKKIQALTAEAISSAEAAYDAAEKDAVKDEVASAMTHWEPELVPQQLIVGGTSDEHHQQSSVSTRRAVVSQEAASEEVPPETQLRALLSSSTAIERSAGASRARRKPSTRRPTKAARPTPMVTVEKLDDGKLVEE